MSQTHGTSLKSLLTAAQSPRTYAQTDFFRTETTLFSHSIFYLKDDKERLVRKVCHGEMAGAVQILG